MVTLSLFDTLLALHCENLMVELLIKFLLPGRHVPATHRHKVNRVDGYMTAVDHFLELTPEVMKQTSMSVDIDNSRNPAVAMSKTIGANWNHYGMNNGGDSLYSNYRAYLFDARQKITQCQSGCGRWSSGYRLQSHTASATGSKRSEKTIELIRDFLSEFSPDEVNDKSSGGAGASKQLDSLQSLGESSGYESFKYRVDDDSSGEDRTMDAATAALATTSSKVSMTLEEHRRTVGSWKTSSRRTESEYEFDLAEDLFAAEAVSLGELLVCFFKSVCLYQNKMLTKRVCIF